MNRDHRTDNQPNPDARRLFSYLDGELRPDERRAFERRIAGDPALKRQVRAYRSLFTALRTLEPHAPAPDLNSRIIASLHFRPSRLSRLRAWLVGGSPWSVANVFDDLHDGVLPARQARALTSLAARDPEAAAALADWGRLHRELRRLATLGPADGFSERVMARVQLPEKRPTRNRVRHLLAGFGRSARSGSPPRRAWHSDPRRPSWQRATCSLPTTRW